MNVYKTIWLTPKRTFEEFVLDNDNQSLFALPIFTMGLIFALDLSPEIGSLLGKDNILWSLLITIPAGVGIAFLILGLIMPGLIKLFGRIWKGPATMRQMVNVCSISFIPFSLILLCQAILFAIGQQPTLERVNGGIYYILSLWSFGLLIIGVSRIQKFSYGMALLNIFISYLPLLIIGLLRN